MGTKKFTDLLKLTRLWHGRAYIAMALFGFLLGKEYSLVLPFTASTLLYVSFAFAINNRFDIETDSKNRSKHNPLVDKSITLWEGFLFSVTIALSGIIIASILPLKAFLVYLVSIFLALIYSAPPRLKTKLPFDLISHGLFFGIYYFFLGFIHLMAVLINIIPYLVPYFFIPVFSK